MRIQDHVKLSAAAAVIALPWLRKDVWIPFAASIVIDVDHYLWHAITQRTLSLSAAVRFFGQADPPQTTSMKLLHHPVVLGWCSFWRYAGVRACSGLSLAACSSMSAGRYPYPAMSYLKRTLSEQAGRCVQCERSEGALATSHVYIPGTCWSLSPGIRRVYVSSAMSLP